MLGLLPDGCTAVMGLLPEVLGLLLGMRSASSGVCAVDGVKGIC